MGTLLICSNEILEKFTIFKNPYIFFPSNMAPPINIEPDNATSPIPEIDEATLEKRARRIKSVFWFVDINDQLTKVDVDEPPYAIASLY